MNTSRSEYFLGANSTEGFFSVYDDLTDPSYGDKLYIIKSGPGSGKSSFMRSIAHNMEQLGHFTEYIYCSGDPDSLDGVYFPDIKTAVVDGTSPHVIEPRYPAVSDNYINLGCYYDLNGVVKEKDKIIEQFSEYKAHYAEAYDFLGRYKKVYDAFSFPTGQYEPYIFKKAKAALHKYGVRSEAPNKMSTAKRRFASAFTYKGMIGHMTDPGKYGNTVLLNSACDLDSLFCKTVYELAREHCLDSVLYLDPLFPDKIDHIALPEIDTVFISRSAAETENIAEQQTVNLDAAVEKSELKRLKKLAKLREKAGDELLELARGELAQAKSHHDRLEELYNPYVDFEAVYNMADSFSESLR